MTTPTLPACTPKGKMRRDPLQRAPRSNNSRKRSSGWKACSKTGPRKLINWPRSNLDSRRQRRTSDKEKTDIIKDKTELILTNTHALIQQKKPPAGPSRQFEDMTARYNDIYKSYMEMDKLHTKDHIELCQAAIDLYERAKRS